MTGPDRAVSTVADVTLALLLVVAAIGILATTVERNGADHDPMAAEYTAQTIAAGTMNVTYDVEEAVTEYASLGDGDGDIDYSDTDLERLAHGPIGAHAAAVAVLNLEFDSDALGPEAGQGTVDLWVDGVDYERAVDEKLRTRLVASNFDAQVIAVWEPLDGGPLRGSAEFGQTPPPDVDVSATTFSVPVDVPSARAEVIEEGTDPGDFDVVASAVAGTVIEGYFPAERSQRALESAGVRHDLTAYRYRRMARILSTDSNDVGDSVVPVLDRRTANATAANAALKEGLANQLEPYLEPEDGARPAAGPLGNATVAAERVSTGTATITVRTWE
ncbi:MAG: DUF7284 family protein [Haloferacaceae archaeon]